MVIGIFDKIKKGFLKAGEAIKKGAERVMDYAAPIVDTVAPIASDLARSAGYGGVSQAIDTGAGVFRGVHNFIGGGGTYGSGRRRPPSILNKRVDDDY
jgi:hypothetical protein